MDVDEIAGGKVTQFDSSLQTFIRLSRLIMDAHFLSRGVSPDYRIKDTFPMYCDTIDRIYTEVFGKFTEKEDNEVKNYRAALIVAIEKMNATPKGESARWQNPKYQVARQEAKAAAWQYERSVMKFADKHGLLAKSAGSAAGNV